MQAKALVQPADEGVERTLSVYLLGSVDFEAALAFQRRLAYEVAGNRDSGALLLCEHAPLVTIGRHGSWRHVVLEPEELRARRWPVRWVNRGGGCILHAPGQLAIYHILPLDRARAECSRSEEHTSELQSQSNLVCRLLLEKKKKMTSHN